MQACTIIPRLTYIAGMHHIPRLTYIKKKIFFLFRGDGFVQISIVPVETRMGQAVILHMM